MIMETGSRINLHVMAEEKKTVGQLQRKKAAQKAQVPRRGESPAYTIFKGSLCTCRVSAVPWEQVRTDKDPLGEAVEPGGPEPTDHTK